ncbi:OsmC family protein [Proteinivorax tanatarense]|uniref:OsmC family protein n=1 Tax=Proteinivorax tanatarense TaxID=1260629 RepID=A0AAU7VPK7_9FIRM
MAFIEVNFPGGKKTEANVKGFTVETDQPVASGGEETDPSPFDLFLTSIVTCSGVYALNFCQNKGISTKGLKLELGFEKNFETGLIEEINLNLTLPEKFPPKYEKAIVKAMNLCAVKKHIETPPNFNINTK